MCCATLSMAAGTGLPAVVLLPRDAHCSGPPYRIVDGWDLVAASVARGYDLIPVVILRPR